MCTYVEKKVDVCMSFGLLPFGPARCNQTTLANADRHASK